MAFTVNIKGLSELQAKLAQLPKQLQVETSAIMEAGAKKWVRDAHRDAPIRKTPITEGGGTFGSNLKQMITCKKIGELAFEIVSGAEYSPYLEWGTLQHVSIPAELEAYASQFWTHSQRKGGIYPHPFFFKQQIPVTLQIEKGVQGILNEIKL